MWCCTNSSYGDAGPQRPLLAGPVGKPRNPRRQRQFVAPKIIPAAMVHDGVNMTRYKRSGLWWEKT